MTSEDAQKLLSEATQELREGRLVVGRASLMRCLEIAPNSAAALDLLAQLELSEGNSDAALAFAKKAVSLQSLSTFVTTLAEALKAKGDLKNASEYFLKVITKLPNDTRSLAGLGDIYRETGNVRQALDCYESILKNNPKNAKIAINYSKLLPPTQLHKGLEALEAARPPEDAPSKIRLSYLSWHTPCKEWATRAQRHMAPYHISDIDELFFNFARDERDAYEAAADEILLNSPEHGSALVAKACCIFTRGLRLESEPIYHKIKSSKPRSIYSNIEFSKAFFEKLLCLSDAQLAAPFPPLTTIKSEIFQDEHIIYLSCNHEYFLNFTRAMLLSINDVAKGSQVHIHIMDATPEELNAAKAFCESLDGIKTALTSETTGLMGGTGDMPASNYYHSIRFIRFYTHLKAYNKTCWMMDVDALMNRDPQSLFKNIETFDTAFRARPGRMEPWNQFSACVFGVRPTEAGLKYLHLVAAYIFHFYNERSLGWGIDQLAMYAAFEHLRDESQAPSVYLLDNIATNLNHTPDGYVWLAAGNDKFVQVKRISKGKDMPEGYENATYFEAFKKYSARLNQP